MDIVSLVETYGINIKRVGNLYRGLCPFHPDRYPSFVVYPETESFFCFGCRKGGDKIEFVKLMENCGFKEAKTKLGLKGETATRHRAPVRRRLSTLRTELKGMEDALEKLLVRGLKRLDEQLHKGEIGLCQYYTKWAIAEDRLNRFDALRIQNRYYLRNWR